MTDSVFDVALEMRFAESAEIATIDVTSADTLLIRDSATGTVMRIPFGTLAAAISSAFSSSFASLVDGKVPASQLPSYVDDVLEYANLAAFPGTGESGKIYVALDTNKTYRWSGSAYAKISASLALGETSSTAYRGDRGKTAYDHSQATGNPHSTTKADVGLANVDNTSDANKPISTAQQIAIDAKPTYTTGSFTPTATNLTYTGGSPTFTGNYVRIGNFVFFTIKITPSAGTTSAVKGSTYFTGLPFVPGVPDTCDACDWGINGYGVGLVYIDGKVWTPTWTSANNQVTVSGRYAI